MSSISQLSPSEIVARDRAAGTDAVAADAVEGARRRRFPAWLALAVPTAIYFGIQLSSLLVFFTGVTAAALALCAATFFVRLFAITGVYHRYFSHRTYRTSRVVQFLLAVVGASAVQKGPLWWASVHRTHHSDSDGPGDPHSPRRGFWHAHQGWILDDRWDAVREERIKDLTRYPELVWLDRWHFLPPLALAVLCYVVGGFTGLVWGFAVSTTLAWHATYSINSLAHRFGSVRFDTGDDSRNNFWLALLTLGEGWHNNHHYYQSCARQGLYWWEIDMTYYGLLLLRALGLIWDLHPVPARLLARDARSPRATPSPASRDGAAR